jgi:hypothetical protein
MLKDLSEEMRFCHAHAEECARRAKEAADDNSRDEYLRLEERWLLLARSYELWECLTRFSNEAARREKERDQAERDQAERIRAPNGAETGWNPISTAPFDREIELAVIVGRDSPHALVFPCRRVLGGWMKAATSERIDLCPTHWREWQENR